MPIDYKKYPPNWKTEIRPRILERANNCCEFCGVPNGKEIVRDKSGHWHSADKYIEACATKSGYYLDKHFPGWSKQPVGLTPVKIVLTIAHLDHDEDNWDVKDDRLAALCQKCHLKYDAPEKAKRRRQKKYANSLFPIIPPTS